MSDQRDGFDGDTECLFTAAGITPTDAGLQAARRKLADMDARMTPERWAGRSVQSAPRLYHLLP
jgi:hypothetical protein